MAMAYYFEVAVGMILMFCLEGEAGYWVVTAWPVTRLPLFFMGICAGLICNRIRSGNVDALECKRIERDLEKSKGYQYRCFTSLQIFMAAKAAVF